MKLPQKGSLSYVVLTDPDKLADEICSDVLAPVEEVADALRMAFELIRREALDSVGK